jgi:hypothetical protein
MHFGALTGMTLGLVGLLVGTGWAIATGHSKVLFIAVAAAGLCVLALTQRGAFIGIFVLAAMNGLPYFDTSPFVTSKVTIADVAIFALLLVAGAWILSPGQDHRPSRSGRALSRAGVLLLLWWVWTLARTVVDHGGSFSRAAGFGRDFAFFALLLIVLPYVRLKSRDIGALLGVLTAGVCLFAVGQIMTGTGLGQPGTLIHLHFTFSESGSGVTRVYADMTDLVTAGVAVSVAASLAARQLRVRLIAIPVALLLTTSTVVQETRARWIGLVVGIVLVSLWLIINDDARVTAILRRRSVIVIGALVFGALVVVLAAPGVVSSGTIGHRLSSVFTELESGGGTVAIRESVTKTMTAYLGEKWPAGLGFISPSAHYFFGLPLGSIRDSDLGVLNAVMTMGVVGAALIYFPVVLMLINCLRRSSAPLTIEYSWLRYGGAIWIVATLVSSVTLVTLFSPSGLVLSAVFLTVLSHPSVLEAQLAVNIPIKIGLNPKPVATQVEYHPLTT